MHGGSILTVECKAMEGRRRDEKIIETRDRKSIWPMAERVALGEYDQLHHFITAGMGCGSGGRQNCLFKRTGSSAAAMPCW